MPVIIRELVIKATVSDSPAGTGSGATPAATAANNLDRESLVRDIVEQVLEIIEKQKER